MAGTNKHTKTYNRDTKHTSFLMWDCEFGGVEELLRVGIPAEEVAFARQLIITEKNYTKHYPLGPGEKIPDFSTDDPNDDLDDCAQMAYVKLLTPMSLNDLSGIWNTVTEARGMFEGDPIQHPRMRPAKKDFTTETTYINSAKSWWGQWGHDYSSNYDLNEYDLFRPDKKARPAKRAKGMPVAGPVSAGPDKSSANPSPVRSLADTGSVATSNILAVLTAPMDVCQMAAALSMDKSDVNRTLYRLKAAGKVSVVSGFGFNDQKGKPVWKAS
ncbi:hypothetical protein T484DRAFT_1756503 [Baffinella frigidus]|nr:hypothetical protein T484DRAFT_1756503 [Cryptophyta sp. CCMP2293]